MIGSHRDQAHFAFAKWRKRILLPCWFIQIPLQLGLMGVFSYRLSNSINSYNGQPDQIPTVEFVWEITNIAFSLASFIINAIQIAKFLAEALTPFGMVVGNVLSVTLSTAILALDVVVYLQHTEKKYSIVALGMDCALLFFTIVAVIYGVIIYRRMLIYDDYHIPHNAKPFGYAEPEDTSYDPQRSSVNVSPEPTSEAAKVSEPRSRGASFISVRRSISGEVPQISLSPQPRPNNERRTSFDHKRDTQYDEYVRKRSGSFHREDIERALGSNTEWNERRPADIVSTGLVPSALARPRANSGGRVSSWTLNLGDETPDPEQQCGHSLVAVPESGEEEDISAVRLGKQRAFSGDRETLLGKSSPQITISSCDRTASGKSLATVSSIYSQDDVPPVPKTERYEAFRPKRFSAYQPPSSSNYS
ncbi:hypothetical protein PG985_013792 [Apiospora marii]|uniref:MARVEL domain-containing protein n=1 Tax=Apiospora marii TaxID=335849 RepID=A0ABR1R6Z0_9PEZI